MCVDCSSTATLLLLLFCNYLFVGISVKCTFCYSFVTNWVVFVSLCISWHVGLLHQIACCHPFGLHFPAVFVFVIIIVDGLTSGNFDLLQSQCHATECFTAETCYGWHLAWQNRHSAEVADVSVAVVVDGIIDKIIWTNETVSSSSTIHYCALVRCHIFWCLGVICGSWRTKTWTGLIWK